MAASRITIQGEPNLMKNRGIMGDILNMDGNVSTGYDTCAPWFERNFCETWCALVWCFAVDEIIWLTLLWCKFSSSLNTAIKNMWQFITNILRTLRACRSRCFMNRIMIATYTVMYCYVSVFILHWCFFHCHNHQIKSLIVYTTVSHRFCGF